MWLSENFRFWWNTFSFDGFVRFSRIFFLWVSMCMIKDIRWQNLWTLRLFPAHISQFKHSHFLVFDLRYSASLIQRLSNFKIRFRIVQLSQIYIVIFSSFFTINKTIHKNIYPQVVNIKYFSITNDIVIQLKYASRGLHSPLHKHKSATVNEHVNLRQHDRY